MERIGCSNQQECPLRNSKRGCFEDIHHKQFPARFYARGIAKAFRELEENKEIRCRQSHNDLHATTEPPEMPSIEVMQQAVINARLNKGGESESAA